MNEGQIALLHRQYVELKFDISQIASKLEHMERLLNNIAAVSGSSSSQETVHDGHTFLDQLPLTSVNDINNFDCIITESSEKFNLLVQLLYLVGGTTPKTIIFNILKKMLTNEAATYYSGQGRKHKLPFMDLKLYNAVTVATRKREPSITDMDLKRITSLFLATAPSRLIKKN